MGKKELYSPERIGALKRKNAISLAALLAFTGAALLACVIMCIVQSTLTARRFELASMAVSTVCGWIAIYWGLDVIGERRKRITHAENLLSGERETVSGVCEITGERFRVPGSIEIVKVSVGGRRLNLDRERLREFDCAGKRVRVECVHGYVVSWEAEI